MATSARQRLIDWANAQEHWVRAIVSAALGSEELPLEAIYAGFLIEKELAAGEVRAVAPLAAAGGEAGASSGEVLRLERLRGVSGVNALAEGQEIVFGPRLTVLYGENAAGKSGYVRILKRIAAGRSAEAVLPSLRDAAARPSAVIDFTLGGHAQTLEWKDEAGVVPLTRLSVFDAGAVSLHVDDELTYVFTPPELAVYRRVHQAIGAVKTRLDAQLAEARPSAGNPFVVHFKRDPVVFPAIEALGAQTDVEALRALPAPEPGRLEALKDQVEALRPEATRGRLQAAISEAEFHGVLFSVARALAAFDWAGFNAALARADEAGSGDDVFAEAEIPGSDLPSWRGFIDAAEAYLHAVGEKTYPHRGDDCLYCRQPLKPPAVTLIKRYRSRVKDGSQAELAARREEISRMPVASLLDSVSRRVESLDEVPALLTRTAAMLELAVKVQADAAASRPVEARELVEVAREVERAATAAQLAAEEQIAALKKQSSERQKALDVASEELRQLENRLVLRAHLDGIDAFVKRARWAAAAAAVSNRLSSVLRSLTEQSKLANEESLNADFEQAFRAECERLRAPPVELDFSGRKGQAARRKVVAAEHRPREILSEGEQKVIALADFLAEVSLRAAPAPVVFDDPVDGLDEKRAEIVAHRLATLGETRQVVVFTHDLAFAAGLAARSAECRCYRVSAEGGRAGFVVSTAGFVSG